MAQVHNKYQEKGEIIKNCYVTSMQADNVHKIIKNVITSWHLVYLILRCVRRANRHNYNHFGMRGGGVGGVLTTPHIGKSVMMVLSLTCKKLEVCGFHFSSGLPCHVLRILKHTWLRQKNSIPSQQQNIHSEKPCLSLTQLSSRKYSKPL